LASKAVDFQKSGTPVSFTEMPRRQKHPLPDFLSPEMQHDGPLRGYRESHKILGQLFRDIEFESTPKPAKPQPPPKKKSKRQRKRERQAGPAHTGTVSGPLEVEVARFVKTVRPAALQPTAALLKSAERCAIQFAADLNYIAGAVDSKAVTETELVVGTILRPSPQPRVRLQSIAKLRERTTELIKRVRETWKDVDDASNEAWFDHSVAAFLTARKDWEGRFGIEAFTVAALGSLLEAGAAILEDME
jgi:RNA-dependent RNA polymerase